MTPLQNPASGPQITGDTLTIGKVLAVQGFPLLAVVVGNGSQDRRNVIAHCHPLAAHSRSCRNNSARSSTLTSPVDLDNVVSTA
jgi:hypothetical protein